MLKTAVACAALMAASIPARAKIYTCQGRNIRTTVATNLFAYSDKAWRLQWPGSGAARRY